MNVWEHQDARQEAEHFCAVHGIDGTVLLDETGGYAERLGVRGVPLNYLVDAGGIVRFVGATTPREMEECLTALFEAPAG